MDKKRKNQIVNFMMNEKYHLRMNGIPRSKWRRRIAESNIRRKLCTADEFIPVWDELEKGGLI